MYEKGYLLSELFPNCNTCILNLNSIELHDTMTYIYALQDPINNY